MRVNTTINLIFKFSLIFITISIIVLIYLNAFSIISFNLDSETLVLTFVGILATFIILNNHSQVDEVKDNFESKIKSLNEVKDNFDGKIKSIDDVVTSILSSIDPKLDNIAREIINNEFSTIDAFDIHKEEDKFYFGKIKVKITIEDSKVLCKNIENGKILKSITLEGDGGIYNLDTDKLYKIYKFYKS